jgi:four helix bundle protein
MNELELRCLKFATTIRDFCRLLKHDTINLVYIKQVVRSSSSIGANYIEANENLGRQDLLMHLKISRKEAKETQYWLDLIITEDEITRIGLKKEAEEIRRILSAILNKIQAKQE